MSPKVRVRLLLSVLTVSLLTFCLVAYDLEFFPATSNLNRIVEQELYDISPAPDDGTTFSTFAATELVDRFTTVATFGDFNVSNFTSRIKPGIFNISSALKGVNNSAFTRDSKPNFDKVLSKQESAKLNSATRNASANNDEISLEERLANSSSVARNLTSAERAERRKLRRLRQMFKGNEHLFKTKQVDCWNVFRRNPEALKKARKVASSPRRLKGIPDAHYEQATKNCSRFVHKRGYITMSLSKEENKFAIAYSLLVYKDLEMVERLLRAIYRPQNYYCIHIDASAKPSFFRAASSLAKCFPNVRIASQRVDVTWGEFSVLKPELVCMRELWHHKNWKYYINLTGQEFPLKTNLEIVRILKAFKGANDVQGTLKHADKYRWRNTMPPHGLQPYKGSVHVVLNRNFVRHILKDKKTIDLLNWTRKTLIPDETLFATMNHNPQLGIKGSYNGDKMETKPSMTRYKNWFGKRPCAWRSVRDICILTVGDLPLLFEARQLFANKFYLSHDRVVIECLEEKNFNRTRAGVFGKHELVDTQYYSNLEFVKHQVQ